MNFKYSAIANTFEITSLLYRFGAYSHHAGFDQTVYAVYLAVQNPDKLSLASVYLFPEIAKHFGTTNEFVEHNISTFAERAWTYHRELICTLAGRDLFLKPNASEFIAIIAFYFLRLSPAA